MPRIVFALLIASILSGCTGYSTQDPILQKDVTELTTAEMQRVVAIMTTSYGRVTIELHPEWAPVATRNFIKLIKGGYYNGMTICEIRPSVWIRGGAPDTGECKGGPGYNVALEKPSAFVSRGMVGLYHLDMMPEEGNSQFFIMLGDAPSMNSGYTIFGKVIEGMPTVDRIGNIKSTPRDGTPRPYMPFTKIVIDDLHLEVKR